MLHYEDNTVEYLDLTYKGDFKHKAISEYNVNDLDLLYTPEAFLSDYSRVLNQVLPELNKVVLDSPAMRTVLGVNADTSLDVSIARTLRNSSDSLVLTWSKAVSRWTSPSILKAMSWLTM